MCKWLNFRVSRCLACLLDDLYQKAHKENDFLNKMAATSATRKKRTRFTLDVNFGSEMEKEEFCIRLNAIRDLMTPPGSAKLDTRRLLLSLFDCAQRERRQTATGSSQLQASLPTHGSFLQNAG